MRMLQTGEVIALVRPSVDAHTLGIDHMANLLRQSGCRVAVAGPSVAAALNNIWEERNAATVADWLRMGRITRVGFSYRLDPREGARLFGEFLAWLRQGSFVEERGGPIVAVYFAGLPTACDLVCAEFGPSVPVFRGDASPMESLQAMGVPLARIPGDVRVKSWYDEMIMSFGRTVVQREWQEAVTPVDRSGYAGFGSLDDHVVKRLEHGGQYDLPPLMRVHVGPYLPDRAEAVRLFAEWVRILRDQGMVDILSIGTSQLTQSRFGDDWSGLPNGGGVPLAGADEYRAIAEGAGPMLVRAYAGSRNVLAMARMHEETLNIAWHALSFWWFCRTDGRGENSVFTNLAEHLATLDYIAATGKPFEPNCPHHFSFRGGDDVTYILSAYLAARVAKRRGVRVLILQNMLNTPKYTTGLQDIAKSRAMLRLVRELEDSSFRVVLQPRAGLDYFSADLDTARAQLAAVTAMMDDIEPGNARSPAIIHVVSYSEAVHLADPPVIDESVRIVRAALEHYRVQRRRGLLPSLEDEDPKIGQCSDELYLEARELLAAIHQSIPDPYSAHGLYQVFAAGFLPVPYLWGCRDEFGNATRWRTAVIRGGVKVVDADGIPVPIRVRAAEAAASAKFRPPPAGRSS